MSATVKQVLECLDAIAPLSLAEEWDNVGLLVGDPEREIDSVVCALDLTNEVIEEAMIRKAGLIVTHHPIMFRGRKTLREDDPEGRMICDLIRNNIALIAMHTNFDSAQPGVNDALAACIGLEDVEVLESGMRLGTVKDMSFAELAGLVEKNLGGPVRRYGYPEATVKKVAVLGGAGEDYASIARAAGADVYITGEMAYHKALDCMAMHMCVLEAGHAATEFPGVNLLSRGLQNAIDALQYKIRVFESKTELFL